LGGGDLYVHYATERVYITEKVTVDDFLLSFASGTSVPSVQSPQWDSTRLGTAFPRWKCPGEIALHVYCSLPNDIRGISKSESLRNAPSQTYYTAKHCKIVQDRPPCHNSFLLYDFLKKLVVTFLNDFLAAYSTSLSWYSHFTSHINSLI
jgi:hypothetical protein